MGKQYQHLNSTERALIQLSLEQGCTLRAIARSVQRDPGTISRELKRNGWQSSQRRRGCLGRPLIAGGYRAASAQQRAEHWAHQPRRARRLRPGTPLWDQVVSLLRRRHSPEQIAGILGRMQAQPPDCCISHETIYTALYALPRDALRTELIACLRQARKQCRPRARGTDRRGLIPNMLSIHLRPPEIEDRVIPGHWEGDLIKGAGNRSAIGTLVERSTLFVTLAKMQDASAAAAVKGFGRVLGRIEAQQRLSLTYDQGREMAQHEKLTAQTGVTVYFADPHSPWQRGINENTNGLLRQYLPKGEDLSQYSQRQLDKIAWELTTRPRKSLGFKCPAELFMPDFDYTAYFNQTVALRV